MNISRRTFLLGGTALAIGAAAPSMSRMENDHIEVTRMDVPVRDLPPAFEGRTIAQLSDLHGKIFGRRQEPLLDLVAAAKPDMICLTGDLYDNSRGGAGVALDLGEQLTSIAPVYACGGNHEWEHGTFAAFADALTQRGVYMLRNKALELAPDCRPNLRGCTPDETASPTSSPLILAGLDGYGGCNNVPAHCEFQLRITLHDTNPKHCTILLEHRPQHMDLFKKYSINLALSGHIHGGQFRVPGLGGMLSPDRTFFPHYDAGLFQENGTSLFVHRGLGNSSLRQRVNNRPELALLRLVQAPGDVHNTNDAPAQGTLAV